MLLLAVWVRVNFRPLIEYRMFFLTLCSDLTVFLSVCFVFMYSFLWRTESLLDE